MTKIVVSYRRKDTPHVTGRIVDRLVELYGGDNVFMDIDSIPVGQDYRERIRSTLEDSDLLLAVVGSNWLKGDGQETSLDEGRIGSGWKSARRWSEKYLCSPY
jgi:hypothetical protein